MRNNDVRRQCALTNRGYSQDTFGESGAITYPLRQQHDALHYGLPSDYDVSNAHVLYKCDVHYSLLHVVHREGRSIRYNDCWLV